MELNKVTTVTKKQAKAYINLIYNEIDEVMKLYTPKNATIKAEEIIQNNKTKWKKIR